LICPLCDLEMSISQRLTEMDGKRCHIDCKDKREKQWKEGKGIKDW